MAESFFATLKNEKVMGEGSRQQARVAITSYIRSFYYPIRLHSALSRLSPDDYVKGKAQAAWSMLLWLPLAEYKFKCLWIGVSAE